MTVNREIPSGRFDRLVARSAARLALAAHGEVLELGRDVPRRYGPEVRRARRLPGPAGAALLAGAAPVDTVLAVCELWRPAWGEAELGALRRLLRPGGRLLFVEPVAVTGASAVAQRLAGPLLRWRHGAAFERDVPGALRAVGLVPVSIDRVCADPVGRARTLVVGVAQCRSAPDATG